MDTLAAACSTTAGAVLVAVAARDIVDGVFHPEGRGTLARLVMRTVWRRFRAVVGNRPRAFSLAGPAGLLVVVFVWASLLAVGFALLIWPHLAGGFAFEGGRRDGFLDALHVSLVNMTTLGFTDAIPDAGWLRVLVPIEAMVGFGLLSASVAWLLLIFPALSRRRSLAYELTLLEEADAGSRALDATGPKAVDRVLAELTSRLVAVERDLVGSPVSYYFPESDARFSMARTAPFMKRLADRYSGDDVPPVPRLRAGMLRQAIVDYEATTAALFGEGPAQPPSSSPRSSA